MYTYLLMGLPFIITALLIDWFLLKTRVITSKQCWIVMALLIIMTALFDQFLAGFPIVLYDESKILGIFVGSAPIEDFMYTIAAVIGLGSIWTHYEKR